MTLRLTRRRCGLACGLLLTWSVPLAAGEDAAAPVALPAPPALIELEASSELVSHLDGLAVERVQERHANRMLKTERSVVQDETGNYYNHGPYSAWDEDGRMMGRGEYRFGARTGKWTRWFSADETTAKYAEHLALGFKAPFTSQAEFVDGRLHGTWTIVDAEQRPVAAWEFEAGDRHGMSTWWFADGKKYREAEYLVGDLDGFVREYDAEQRVVLEKKYVAGHRLGVQVEYYDTGELKAECETVFAKNIVHNHDDWWNGTTAVSAGGREGADQRHGKFQAWDRAGNLILSGRYNDDRPDGKFTWYYANGNRAIEGAYVAGRQDGLWTWWHENGLKEIVGEYAMGAEIGHWQQWGDNGRVAETLDIHGEGMLKASPNTELSPPPAPIIPANAAEEPAAPKSVRPVMFEAPALPGDGFTTEEVPVEQSTPAAVAPGKGPVLKVVPARPE